MSKRDRSERQAAIDSIRKQQRSAERRRGGLLVALCLIIGLAIIGAAAWKPLSDKWKVAKYSSESVTDIGVAASECSKITTKKAEGNQDHVPEGTPMTYPDSPPAFGQHWNIWDTMERKLYTESDRPELGEIVHNLEHGYTIVWYDETAAKDKQTMDVLRGLSSKFAGTDNMRHKFKAVPWTSKDGDPFPDGMHIAYTHWSIGGVGETDPKKQVGAWQYCPSPSGEALEKFMLKYPYMDSPEPTVV